MSGSAVTRSSVAQRLVGLAALAIRVTFAALAAVQLIGTAMVVRTAVVAVLITWLTGSATRIDRALS